MKKIICVFTVLYLLFFSCITAQADNSASDAAHTTTVMIYMCGSDLESRFGSATKDLTEMIASGFNSELTHVLVMAGGSRQWRSGFNAKITSVAEVTSKGLRTVWRSEEKLNMAESSTLASFLSYSMENYPAERYALILWDHGGGPNEGACYDELFNNTTLSLPELQSALSTVGFSSFHKIDWIGFDACLMATVETAYMLENYADILIASQAEEPSAGWNYAFLKGLENDENAAATAERVIDAYFAGNTADSNITLSSIDLGKLYAVRMAMDSYFDALFPVLTDETYSGISRERHLMKSFGRAEYNDAADYDLVDLYSLALCGRGNTVYGERLAAAIEECVLCSRSDSPDAHGISVYHPCFNRGSYLEKWAESYEKTFSTLSRSYVLYVRRFGSILTGKELGSWSGLETERTVEDNGDIRFTVSLTDEQAAHFEHATFMTFEQVYGSGQLIPAYYLVWETPYLSLSEDNTLSAVYPQRAVFAVSDETGELLAGPIDYRITHDGKLQIYLIYWDENGILDDDMLLAMATCSFTEESNHLQVESIWAYNNAAREYSPRVEVTQEYLASRDDHSVIFFILERYPLYKGDELLAYEDWPAYDSFVYDEIELPQNWHYEVFDGYENPEMIFAAFQIKDTQSIAHSSTLSRVYPDRVSDIAVCEDPGNVHSGDYSLSVSAHFYPESGMLSVTLRAANPSGRMYDYRVNNVKLNESAKIKGPSPMSFGSAPVIITIPQENRMDIEEIRSMEFDLTLRSGNRETLAEDHIKLLFTNGVPLHK